MSSVVLSRRWSVLFGKVFRFAQGNSGKRHKKALGKAWNQRSLAEGKSKSGAEGESLKLLKESGAIFLVLASLSCVPLVASDRRSSAVESKKDVENVKKEGRKVLKM